MKWPWVRYHEAERHADRAEAALEDAHEQRREAQRIAAEAVQLRIENGFAKAITTIFEGRK